MFIIHLEHAPDSIRGELSLFCQEISTYLFISSASTKTRDLLWKDIISIEGISAVLVYPDKTESGYAIRKYGKPTYEIEELDGLNIIAKPSNFQTKSIAEKLWAKNPILNEEDKKNYAKGNTKKTLIDHMIETGTVASCLLDGIYSPLLQRLSKLTKTDEKKLFQKIVFICAIHDIGKAHPLFQAQDVDTENMLEAAELNQLPFEKIRHEKYSEELLQTLCKKDAKDANLNAIGQIVGLHHQKESHDETCVDIEKTNNLAKRWREIQRYIYNFIKEAFQFDDLNILGEAKDNIFVVQNGILGVLITADWIASSEGVFKEERSFRDYADIADFIEDRKRWIHLFLSENNLAKNSIPSVSNFDSVFGFNGRPVQKDVEKIVKNNNVKLMLIESGCGSGKTEAALYAAAVLGNRYGLSGMYMGLPTGVTAAALQNRFEDFLTQKLKITGKAKAKLMTSQAFLLQEHDDNDNTKESPEWTDYSRQRLLYPYAIGTVDQIMSVARLVRFESIRMAGISSKVVIIDEIHAYDMYMMTVIERLLQICGELGIPVIMLSATLPVSTKQRIFTTITNKNISVSPGYPMISYVTTNNEFYECTSQSHEEDRSVKCNLLPILDNETEIAKEAIKNIENGGCECIVVNTVSSAIKIYDKVKESAKETDYTIILYHAKMTINAREAKSKEILNLFGKDRKNRPQKAIVIGTQVLEQSLDVDFDYMMSAICPIDLLLQRIGRYHRHNDEGTIRETKEIEPCVQVLIPDTNGDYGGTGHIYEKCFLDATICEIKKKKIFTIPSCIPEVVNSVYSKISNDKEVKNIIDRSKSDLGNIDISSGFDIWIKRNQLTDKNLMVRLKEGGLTEQIAILSEDEIKELGKDRKNDTELFKERVVSIRNRDLNGFINSKSVNGIFKRVKIFTCSNCKSEDKKEKISIDDEYGFRILKI